MSTDTMGSGGSDARWYDLFSRGARDWLRHNEKVRDAVRDALPDLISSSDILSNPGQRTLKVPVRFMEHHRFRLCDPSEQQGAGQGAVQPGDVLRRGQPRERGSREAGGEGEGGVRFVLELGIDDVLDWLWEELQLPHLKPTAGGAMEDVELVREGWDRHGARSRLDRRRTVKEAVKRRSVQGQSAIPFSNDDLRFRQLARRRRPSNSAVVFLVLDVSSSMDEHCRRLAKTFFFWALQGVRRQFSRIETVFVAHTIRAWEFDEEQFFQVRGEGGTKASTGLGLSREIMHERYGADRYNRYLFYASDGENFTEDVDACEETLAALASELNFLGYAEVSHRLHNRLTTEMAGIVKRSCRSGLSGASYAISRQEDIWPAIRAFFQEQSSSAEEHP